MKRSTIISFVGDDSILVGRFRATRARCRGYRRMTRFAALLTLLCSVACTHWDTTNVTSTAGPRREVGRHMIGDPTIEEVTSSGVTAGLGGESAPTMSGGTIAVGGLSAGMTTVKRKHCVQQAQIDYSLAEDLQPTTAKRGLDLGVSIPMLAVGLLTIASVNQSYSNSMYDYNQGYSSTRPDTPLAGYAIGGALAAIGGAWLGYSVGFLPNGPRPQLPPREKRWTETTYVEVQGCAPAPVGQ